ncbi:MAG: HAMP domain-containing protein [Anaerolineae bacterium]|nr:HAMP domain-containing protein [Anaerolineae bacterium]
MRLRQKLLLTIGLLLASLVLILYVTSRGILLGSFAELETRTMHQNMQRVLNVLEVEQEALVLLASRWAWWDETYAFLQGEQPAFETTHLTPESFASLRLNAILLADSDGEIVYQAGYDLYLQAPADVPDALLTLAEDPPASADPVIQSGYLALPDGPMLVLVAPVLNDNRDLPAAGTMIWGRRLNTQEIQRLSQITRLPITISRYDAPEAGMQPPLPAPGQDNITSTLLDETRIASYAALQDLGRQPSLLLQIIQPRDLYSRGQSVLMAMLAAILAFSLLTILGSSLLLNWAVLRRLLRLTDEVEAISHSSDITSRVSVDGQDEIASLSARVNDMLGSLQKSQEALAEAQAHLAHSARLAAAGEVAAGVAHQINNPLTTIIAEIHLLTSLYTLDDDMLASVEAIREAAYRAGTIVEQMLDLARSVPFEMEQTDINASIQSAIALVKAQVEPHVSRLAIELAPDLPLIKASGKHLEDVVWINLLLNARDALRNNPDGRITVRTSYDPIDDMVDIIIEDNGEGIRAEDLPHIFTPFFTTKSYGTGLGLAICHDVVQRHNGIIRVKSEVGKGATFIVRLPATQAGTRGP